MKAYVFPGQGAQFVGMGKDLYENNSLAKEMFEKLREKGIFVRYFNKPRICDYLRITIGTDEQMECFLKEVKAILQQ